MALMLIIITVVVVSTVIFTHLLVQNRRNHVIEREDNRLLIAAKMLHEMLGADYHTNIVDASSVSEETYQDIVARNDHLCRTLDLQYLWSVLVLEDNIVFTSATRTDIFDPTSNHAAFYETHKDPAAFDPALGREQKPVFSTFRNEWGKGRMVLVPYTDDLGRTYIFGASVQMTEYLSMLRRTVFASIGIGLLVFAGAIILALMLARRMTRPISRLTELARHMASGALNEPLEASGTSEMRSLARSLDLMRKGLQEQFAKLRISKKREESENLILTNISKREPLEQILTRIALFCEQLDAKIRASILLYDEKTKSLYHAAGPSLPADYNELLKGGLPIGQQVGSCGTAAYLGKRVVTTDIANDYLWKPYKVFLEKTAAYGLKACWSQPFYSSGGQLLGTIANYSQQTGEPTVENLKVLEWATRIAGLAVEQDRAEKELIAAKLLAEQNDKLKTAFLQNMSHEIRTPLNGIIGFSSLLRDFEDFPKEKRDQYIDLVVSSSNRLLAIVDDVLQLSRIESGLLKENRSVFYLREIPVYLGGLFTARAKEKGLTFEAKIFDGLANKELFADKGKVFQIMTNLVNNAIKFTKKGGIELYAKKEKQGISINVRDTGIGIDESYHKKIFERFWQHEAFSDDFYGGTGLGLSISKGLAEFMGFKITVQSEPGKGSEFGLFMPDHLIYNGENLLHEPVSNDAKSNEVLKGLRFLIAEDDKVSYLYVSELLTHVGAEYTWVTDGRQAVELLENNSFDVVLMDLKMPVMDGAEATRIIKSKYPGIIVIAQTAHMSDSDQQAAFRAGCDALIKKPFLKEEFLQTLSRLRSSSIY